MQKIPHVHFVQDNHSCSNPGVLRGLHFQKRVPQGKLVSCIHGAIFDVAVDLRKNSATFGHSFGTELSAKNGKMLWIPKGFAHGFCVLGSESADVYYKVDEKYSPQDDSGIIWNDEQLKIQWPISIPQLSTKDAQLPSFEDFLKFSSADLK